MTTPPTLVRGSCGPPSAELDGDVWLMGLPSVSRVGEAAVAAAMGTLDRAFHAVAPVGLQRRRPRGTPCAAAGAGLGWVPCRNGHPNLQTPLTERQALSAGSASASTRLVVN